MQKFRDRNFVRDIKDLIPAKNTSPHKRILAIGDLHGKFDKFKSLWKKISATEKDLVIFLGDYIDRGSQVIATLEWIIAQSQQKNFIFLRGNHEQMMLDSFYKQSKKAKLHWLDNGGDVTLHELIKADAEDKTYLRKILTFAKNLPLYHSMTIGGRKYVFVHAGLKSNTPLEKQDNYSLLFERPKFYDKNFGYNGKDIIIVGHTRTQKISVENPVAPDKYSVMLNHKGKYLIGYAPRRYFKNNQPYRIPNRNILMMETGSCMRNGHISCVDILSGELWQSD